MQVSNSELFFVLIWIRTLQSVVHNIRLISFTYSIRTVNYKIINEEIMT